MNIEADGDKLSVFLILKINGQIWNLSLQLSKITGCRGRHPLQSSKSMGWVEPILSPQSCRGGVSPPAINKEEL